MRKMKDSGVQWIGEIPENWEVRRLKFLTTEPLQYGANATGVEYTCEFPRYIRITDITRDGELTNNNMQSLSISERNYYILEHGDILFARSGATAGKSFLYNRSFGEACFAGYLIKCKADKLLIDGRFLYYATLTRGYEDWTQQIFIQSTIPNISAEKYNNLSFPIPTQLNIQENIINYLDKKCTEIDSVIKTKETTNEKLKQYRQSVIHEAVTKGLDKNAEMKDSGIQWIGEIPENWEVRKLKYIFKFGTGLSITRAELLETGIRCVNYGEIHSKYKFDLDLERDILKCANEKLLESKQNSIAVNGDFIFCDTSEDIEGCGNCLYVESTNNQNLFAGSHTVLAKPIIPVRSRYLAYLFSTPIWRLQVRKMVSGIKVFSITQGILKDTFALLPNNIEQEQICSYLDKKCAEIDSVMKANENTITKLKEYRQSVIYEAVTGKVEV